MSEPDAQRDPSKLAEIDARYRTARTAIRTVGWVACAFFAYKAIGQVSGQTTVISVAINVILNALVDLKFALTITLAGVCAAWAVAERILRHRAVARLGARNARWETMLDSKRTTSGLTVEGKTNPIDKGR
jgi:hypothetical protein